MENTPMPEETHLPQFEQKIDLQELRTAVDAIRDNIAQVIVGQEDVIDYLIAAILANGHVLLEGVPGVAKTLTAKLVAKSLDIQFNRIQFTPDLMPSDILGTSTFNMKTSEFQFRKGPIFSQLVLIDEINRAPAKTQAALFEVMEERQISIDGEQFTMDAPFLVLATQNPIEQEGTYRLPEAQLDRFLFKINIEHPELDHEIEILTRENNQDGTDKTAAIGSVIKGIDIQTLQQTVRKILVENDLLKYIAQVVCQTREHPFIFLGASPRASIAILNAAKAFAAIAGRDFVIPDDVKAAAVPVLIHRIVVSPEREMEGVTAKEIITQIIENTEIPR
ncbi:AAA family ATPase [Flavobacterium aurantiibacter]|uniref:Magnesium chelatase n=1 Tax=Flavobacterium aurantiibacter TaxID=2023067 RepID=A0A255ZWL7_9FLAO|nr:MoxR family ATPase [Flavobacterium aurantiibacter]OYQ45927.1 magnesium chelatase [Flavobacterium aurantiibacter]